VKTLARLSYQWESKSLTLSKRSIRSASKTFSKRRSREKSMTTRKTMLEVWMKKTLTGLSKSDTPELKWIRSKGNYQTKSLNCSPISTSWKASSVLLKKSTKDNQQLRRRP